MVDSINIIIPNTENDLKSINIDTNNSYYICTKNNTLYEILNEKYKNVYCIDYFTTYSQRVYSNKWLNDFLSQWIIYLKDITHNSDLASVFAILIYWPLIEIVINCQLIISLEYRFANINKIVIFVVKDSIMHSIIRSVSADHNINWDIRISNELDTRSFWERNKQKNFENIFREKKGYKLIKSYLKIIIFSIKYIRTQLISNKRSIILIGEQGFYQLKQTITSLGYNCLLIPSYISSIFINKQINSIMLDDANTVFDSIINETPFKASKYNNLEINGIINSEINSLFILNKDNWINLILFCEHFIMRSTTKLIITSTLDGPINAISTYVANAYGVKTMMMVDGYSINSVAMPIKPEYSPIYMSTYLAFCNLPQKESFLREGIKLESLINMPSPLIRSSKTPPNPIKHYYDLVIYTYFVGIINVIQNYSASEKYLSDCINLAIKLKYKNILIKYKYFEEIKLFDSLIKYYSKYFDYISIKSKHSKKYLLYSDVIIGGLSTAMAECAVIGGQYYIYEPMYGGMKATKDDKFIRRNGIIATNVHDLEYNIKSFKYFCSTPDQINNYGIDIHLNRNEEVIWRDSINTILQ